MLSAWDPNRRCRRGSCRRRCRPRPRSAPRRVARLGPGSLVATGRHRRSGRQRLQVSRGRRRRQPGGRTAQRQRRSQEHHRDWPDERVPLPVQVAALTPRGTGPMSALSNAVTPAKVPGAPVVGTASSGAAGGQLTATARWSPPASNGGSPVTAYVVTALRMSSSAPGARVLARVNSPALAASARSRVLVLPAGLYRFHVVARNAGGTSCPLHGRMRSPPGSSPVSERGP
jgi:hypothetical protein